MVFVLAVCVLCILRLLCLIVKYALSFVLVNLLLVRFDEAFTFN